jgi:hypothetical protein
MTSKMKPGPQQDTARQVVKKKALSGARGILTGLGVSGSFWLATLVLFIRH